MTISTVKIGTIRGKSLNSDLSTEARYVAVRERGIPTAVRWLFLLFIFSLPFELAVTGSSTISRMVGILFFACYFFAYNPFLQERSFPPIPGAMWWFLGYLAVFALNGVFIGEEFIDDFFVRFLTLVQLLVFFWVASDLLKDKELARTAVLTYSIASVLLAIGALLQLPGFYSEVVPGRATALGENANSVGTHMAIAVVIFIGLRLYAPYKHFMGKILLLGLTLPPLAVGIATASRGAVLALITGLLAYLSPLWRRRPKQTLAVIVLTTVGISAVVYMVANNPDFMERWQKTYYEGSLSSREKIYPPAIEMILERPIFGWRPVEGPSELGRRLGTWNLIDAHNLILALLVEVGLVGAIPFLVGLGLCGRAAWRGRSGNLGLLPLAVLFSMVTYAMSSTTLVQKPQWFVLALTLAAVPATSQGIRKKFPVVLVGRPRKTVRKPS